jgi:flagellar biosynthesis/type III secretory pathway protein FliH
MAKKTKGAQKGGKNAKKSGKKKGGRKAPANGAAPSSATLHGVCDSMAAFENAVRNSTHPRRAEMLQLVEESKQIWKKFCLALADECEKPTSDFCEP